MECLFFTCWCAGKVGILLAFLFFLFFLANFPKGASHLSLDNHCLPSFLSELARVESCSLTMNFLVCPRTSFPGLRKPVFPWSNILGRWAIQVHLCHIKKLYCPCCSLLFSHSTPTICFSANKLCWNFLNFCSRVVIYFKSTYFLHLLSSRSSLLW